jgi:hypothetical protein
MVYLASIGVGTGTYLLFLTCRESRALAGVMAAAAVILTVRAFIV